MRTNSKELHPESTNLAQYFIVMKNFLTIWRDNSFRVSIAGVSIERVLPDPVSTITTETLSKVKGGILVPPKAQEQVELKVKSPRGG